MTWKQATFVVDQSEVEKLTGLLEAFLAAAVTTENAGDDEFYERASRAHVPLQQGVRDDRAREGKRWHRHRREACMAAGRESQVTEGGAAYPGLDQSEGFCAPGQRSRRH